MLVLFFALLLNGCQTATLLPSSALSSETIYVETPFPYTSFSSTLHAMLERVSCVSHKKKPSLILKIESKRFSHSIPPLSASPQVRFYRLTYELIFSLKRPKGHTLLSQQHVQVQREFILKPNQLMSSNNEIQVVRHEMERALVFRLLNRLSSPQVTRLLKE